MGVHEQPPRAKTPRMQRRWVVTLAGAGTAVVAARLSVLLMVLLSSAQPAAGQRDAPVRYLYPHPHLVLLRPAAAPSQLVSPFTGEPVKALGRVLVVKIANIVDPRPPTSRTPADTGYMRPVE